MSPYVGYAVRFVIIQVFRSCVSTCDTLAMFICIKSKNLSFGFYILLPFHLHRSHYCICLSIFSKSSHSRFHQVNTYVYNTYSYSEIYTTIAGLSLKSVLTNMYFSSRAAAIRQRSSRKSQVMFASVFS